LDADGKSIEEGDPALQTQEIIRIAKQVLERAGSGLEDVIRTRIYVTDISMVD
jgi:enamine deaminase RidA (YjgF/YER057c/UK114 family)